MSCTSKVNFRVVENDTFFDDVKDEYLRLYYDDVPMKEIMGRLNLTESQYLGFHRRLVRSGDIIGNRSHGKYKRQVIKASKCNPKYYYWSHSNCKWYVTYRNKFYASFHKKSQAEEFVELMKQNNWDFNKREELKESVLND